VLLIVAVDAETGEPAMFDRFADTSLVDAVAASCAVPGVWPPVTIHGRRYMDGGTRSSDNADLARGYARTVIVSPNGTTRLDIRGQMTLLESAGGQTYLVEPDEASRTVMGVNPLLPETRIPAAEEGRKQGHAIAQDIARFWGVSGSR
jgi:NTE family protein